MSPRPPRSSLLFPRSGRLLSRCSGLSLSHKPGVVIDGRDIGTVIAPEAEVKIYVTATAEERANRRVPRVAGPWRPVDAAAVLADIKARDDRDMNRAVAPLKPAPDAVLLDTTHLGIDAAVRAAIDIVEAVRAGRRPA